MNVVNNGLSDVGGICEMEALIAMEDGFFHKSSFFFSYALIP
jgi:hypothetical protein